MKRLVVVLGGLLALPAFAEVAPFYYDGVTEYADAEMVADGDVVGDEIVAENVASKPVVQPKPVARVNSPRVTSSRGTSASAGATSGRVTSRGTASRSVTSRGATTTTSAVSPRSAVKTNATTARVGVRANTTGTMTTSTGSTVGVADAGYTGRVGVRAAGSVARAPSVAAVSVSNATTATTESVKDTTDKMDALAELTDYCKAQYVSCMDNFCDVLDDNQGRCSCSKNVKNYEKTENALKAATEELQEVAQKIQYIGLSSDEITTLFAETEAEETMRGASDSSEIKSSLDKIKNMIVDVKGGTASTIADASGMSFDLSNLLSFNFDNSGFDLSALFGTSSANTASVANQRGETLYKTAAARCKAAVLNSCSSQGVDIAVITNSYDLEIDKQCIAYERALTDSNSQMLATVRNARGVLQKARLMVAQQKNQYDLRGCVSALDSCMQDDYVCGADYEYCLDPSGKYVVDGSIVVGSLPGKALNDASDGAGIYNDNIYATWSYSAPPSGTCNANSCSAFADMPEKGTLSEYINKTGLAKQTDLPAGNNMAEFLQYKIGYNDSGKNYGMCMSVLNKCQDYTYVNGAYNPGNRVISEYLYRTLPKIKTAQDNLLTSYAESCVSDVSSCLSSNGYAKDAGTTVKNIAINSCKAVISTCMSVNGKVTDAPDPTELSNFAGWVMGETTSSSGTQQQTGGVQQGSNYSWVDRAASNDESSIMEVCDDAHSGSLDSDGNCSCIEGAIPEYCYISGQNGYFEPDRNDGGYTWCPTGTKVRACQCTEGCRLEGDDDAGWYCYC